MTNHQVNIHELHLAGIPPLTPDGKKLFYVSHEISPELLLFWVWTGLPGDQHKDMSQLQCPAMTLVPPVRNVSGLQGQGKDLWLISHVTLSSIH